MTLAVSYLPDSDPGRAAAPLLRAVPTAPLGPAGPAPARPAAEPGVRPVAVLHAPAGRDTAAPLRLTRRGVAVLAAAVALAGVALVWLAVRSAPPAVASRPAPAVVTVRSGDTLWSIATRVAPQADPRAEVAALQQANHLTGVALAPGQRLHIPH